MKVDIFTDDNHKKMSGLLISQFYVQQIVEEWEKEWRKIEKHFLKPTFQNSITYRLPCEEYNCHECFVHEAEQVKCKSLNQISCGDWHIISCSRQGPEAGSYEHGNEPWGSIDREFLTSWATIGFWRRTLIQELDFLLFTLLWTLSYLLDLFLIDLFSMLLSRSLSTPFLNGDGVLDRLCEN
jgi:hypothetical protein